MKGKGFEFAANTDKLVNYTVTSSNNSSTSDAWADLVLECVLLLTKDVNMTDHDTNSLLNLFSSYSDQSTDAAELVVSADEGNKSRIIGLLTECLDSGSPSDRPYLLPWWQQLTWTLAFGAMLLIAVGGNAIVMWIVIGKLTCSSIYLLISCCVSNKTSSY